MKDELIHSEVHTERLINTYLTLIHGLPDMLAQDALLSRFSFKSVKVRDSAWEA